MHFLDASAVVKLYADEQDHESIRSIAPPLVVSELSRVEVASAFWRKHRRGEIDARDAAVLAGAFEVDWKHSDRSRFFPIAVTPDILDRAALLTGTAGLRAYDAVQLSSAIATRAVVPDCSAFTAFDLALNRAAATLGFTTRPTL